MRFELLSKENSDNRLPKCIHWTPKMFHFIEIIITILALSKLLNGHNVDALNDNKFEHKYYNGLLSDVLQVNNLNNLPITPRCDRQLTLIQNSLNSKRIWAIKRKFKCDFLITRVFSHYCSFVWSLRNSWSGWVHTA